MQICRVQEFGIFIHRPHTLLHTPTLSLEGDQALGFRPVATALLRSRDSTIPIIQLLPYYGIKTTTTVDSDLLLHMFDSHFQSNQC